MSQQLYITATAAIHQQAVFKNSFVIFENKKIAVNEFLVEAYRHFAFNYPKFYKMDNLSKLGWLAAEILLKDNFKPENYLPEARGVLLTNASSSLDTDTKYFETVKSIPSPALFVYTLPNIVIGEICIRHHFKGENAFFIAEDFDPGFIEQQVNNLFYNHTVEVCICGWIELLGNQYKTVLFLVEKNKNSNSLPFTKENIYKTYQLENG